MKTVILPSVMAHSQQELNGLFKKLKGVASELHLDVADGLFVPSRILQFPFRLSRYFSYNVHLMVKRPQKWIIQYGRRVDIIFVHSEVLGSPVSYAMWMKEQKKSVGFAIKPETKVREIQFLLPYTDQILLLTVHPGYYGARYLKSALAKIRQIKKINPNIRVTVDGGMNPITVKDAVKAGADVIVAGHFITQSDHPIEAMHALRRAIKRYL